MGQGGDTGRGQEPSMAQIKLSFIHIPQHTRGGGMGGGGTAPLGQEGAHPAPRHPHNTPHPCQSHPARPPVHTDPPNHPRVPCTVSPSSHCHLVGVPSSARGGFGGGSQLPLTPLCPAVGGSHPPGETGGTGTGSLGRKTNLRRQPGGAGSCGQGGPGGSLGTGQGRALGGHEGLRSSPPPAALVHFEEVGVGLQEVEAVVHQETGGDKGVPCRVGRGGLGEP